MNNREFQDIQKNVNEDDQKENSFSSQKHKSSNAQAYFNYISSVVGIGIIILPFVASQVGWLLSIILTIPIAFCVIVYSFIKLFSLLSGPRFLLAIADDLQNDQILYSDVARVTLGGKWPEVCNSLLIISQIGICSAYLIFLTQFSQIQAQQYGVEMSRLSFLLFTTIIILPLTFIQNVHYFHQASTFAFFLAVAGILITLICLFWGYYIDNIIPSQVNIFKIEGTFNFIGVSIVCFTGVMTVLPIRDSMKEKTHFEAVYVLATLTTYAIAIFFFETSIIFLGSDMKEVLIYNISYKIKLLNNQNRELQLLASALYAISILLTYPIQLFVALQIIDNIFEFRNYSQINDSDILTWQFNQKNLKKYNVFASDLTSITQRLVITLFIYIVTYFVPNIIVFLNLLGNIVGSLTQYVFPLIFHWVYFKGRKQLPYIQYSIIIFFSTISLIFAPYDFIKSQ